MKRMIVPRIPEDEKERLADLHALRLLDTPAEERFDKIVKLASHVLGTPWAFISLIDSDRQWFKSKCGIAMEQSPRDISFCGHTILSNEPTLVPDAQQDERFADNPLVVGEPHLRFYAGWPLKSPNNRNVGTLCIAGPQPRELSDHERETFRQLAELAQRELHLVRLVAVQRDLIQTKNQLVAAQTQIRRELDQAASYLRSLLPAKLAGPGIATDWQFIASSQLGGDLFGYHWLNDKQLAVYLLDVCGHGVGAALLAVSAWQALRRQTLPNVRFDQPQDVLKAMNRAFPMEANHNRFFTLWYGIYQPEARTLCYASAGHPPAVLLADRDSDGQTMTLGEPGLMIGVTDDADYEASTATVPASARLYLYSDGAYEVRNSQGRMLNLAGLTDLLSRTRAAATNGQASASRVDQIVQQIRIYQGSDDFEDDFSLLELSL